jgi:ribosome-associated protein
MIAPEEDEEEGPPSKTQRKRAMEELQALGEELVDLAPDRLKKIDLPEDLRAAVRTAQRMTRHDEARRRQLQYIGRVMRDIEDPEPIRKALAALRGDSAEETGRLHRIERLRTALLADEGVLYGIAEAYPDVDLQRLRSLRRAALSEQEQGKSPRNYRAIFQLLKELEVLGADATGKDKHEQR